MRLIKILFILFFLTTLLGQGNASEVFPRQVTTVLMFYETLATETATVQQFFELFSEHDEAELEIILRQKFPSLDPKGNWFNNQEAKKYVDEIYKHPDRFPSKFLHCIKTVESLLFASRVNRLLEFPPKTTKDFRTFSVLTRDKLVQFVFLHDEHTIENIYLPDGKSIYSLIPSCINK